MQTKFIQLINLTLRRGSQTVLNNVNCAIAAGEFVAIIGPNGAGKTTLLRLLCDLHRPDHGNVRFMGDNSIGYAPDTPPLYATDSVSGYLKFIAKLKKVSINRVSDVLSILDLEEVHAKKINTLSKGMAQRVNLAQAILCEPSLLVLDEPTNALDEEHSAKFCEYLCGLTGTTIIMASHQYSDFIKSCDYMLKIHNQKLDKILSASRPVATEVTHDLHHHTT